MFTLQRIYKQTVTADMKNTTLRGDDSYPSRLAGIKGGQLRSRQFRRSSEVEEGQYERISEGQRCKMQTTVRNS
jgi:hypothetical protein